MKKTMKSCVMFALAFMGCGILLYPLGVLSAADFNPFSWPDDTRKGIVMAWFIVGGFLSLMVAFSSNPERDSRNYD